MYKVLLACLVTAALCSCTPPREDLKNRGVEKAHRVDRALMAASYDTMVVKENEHGITYFVTCIEGYTFIATSGYREMSLAGPLNHCTEK